MMKDLFKMRGRKSLNPEVYELACKKCEYEETVQLANSIVTLPIFSYEAEEDVPRQVESLPKRCPRCGAAVKRSKVPICLHWHS
ncbi:MAG: hypothetical protein ACOX9E_00015 [Lentisphaeria bacterium]|jgi:hypothetical protein